MFIPLSASVGVCVCVCSCACMRLHWVIFAGLSLLTRFMQVSYSYQPDNRTKNNASFSVPPVGRGDNEEVIFMPEVKLEATVWN